MCEALKILGIQNCYHPDFDSDDCTFWTTAMQAKYKGVGKLFGKEEWDHIFADCDAVSDLPAILFASELAEAYPEAKIILSIRNTESWAHSMMQTICNPVYRNWYHRFPALVIAKEHDLCEMSDLCEEIAWNLDFEKHGISFYAKYNESIRGLVPDGDQEKPLSDRYFLEWKLGEGWDRLAPFLGRDIPAESYPGGNGAADFTTEAYAHTRHMWLAALRRLSAGAFAAAIVSWSVKQLMI